MGSDGNFCLEVSKEERTKNRLEKTLHLVEEVKQTQPFRKKQDSIQTEEFPLLQKVEPWREEIPGFARIEIPNWNELQIEELANRVEGLKNTTNNIDTKVELEDFLGILEDELHFNGDEYDFDPLHIVDKYKGGRVQEEGGYSQVIDETWREWVPSYFKSKFPAWRTANIEVVYKEAKSVMDQNRSIMVPFVSELSQIVFEQQEEDSLEVEEDTTRDEIGDSIMSIIEMIILPHIEVLDYIEKNGGNVTYVDMWQKPFTEELREKVKDRDGWQCVICEGETHLHVHHKIPRDKGGVNHNDNLVTLCSSCHKVIETADTQQAFNKCMANYQKNKHQSLKPNHQSVDKSILRDEVERTLDQILLKLNDKDEHKMVEEISGVMQRLEILFYD